jgi:hypothetical protein
MGVAVASRLSGRICFGVFFAIALLVAFLNETEATRLQPRGTQSATTHTIKTIRTPIATKSGTNTTRPPPRQFRNVL